MEAKHLAQKDFEGGNYFLHRSEFDPIDSSYFLVLKEDYNIQWRFFEHDSLDYYSCYDSTLVDLLKKKYGANFLEIGSAKVDSIETTENWKSKPEFPGGDIAMIEFINDRIDLEPGDLGGVDKTKIFIGFTITENGELEDIKMLKGISEKIDGKIVQIFEEMPNWKPEYLYGKPIRQGYIYPIILRLR
jgi:hypothetical protein